MSSPLLTSPLRHSHSEALDLSRQTPDYLHKYTTRNARISIPWVSDPESSELWATYEKLMVSCLRTEDDKSALQCLEKLIDRFGATNERVMGLRGLYQEAVATDASALEKVLLEYDAVLAEDPVNTPVMKRRIALLRSLARTTDAIVALVAMLDASPTDIEAWAELSDLYLSQGMFSQAAFCLEEVLLVAPNAWNIHARLGEILYISAGNSANSNENNPDKVLAESMCRFCRSIELCDGYLRGYYGLKMTTDRLLECIPKSSRPASTSVTTVDSVEVQIPPLATIHKLNERATLMLSDITRRKVGADSIERDYSEIMAARQLLDRSTQIRQR